MKKMKILVCMIIMLLATSHYARAGITSVSIDPIEPTINDFISIITEGAEGTRPVGITPALTITGNNIVIDLSMEVGILPTVTTWSHIENVGYLATGIYSLEVNAIYSPTTTQTVSTSFEVVPEPLTFAFLALGGLIIRV